MKRKLTQAFRFRAIGRIGRDPLGHRQRSHAFRWIADTGSSLVYALVIAIVLAITGLAVSSRTLFGVFGAAFSQDTRRAREAAEMGASRIVAELNRERNRGLLAVNPAGAFWSSGQGENQCAANYDDPTDRPSQPDLDRVRSGGIAGTFASPPVVYLDTNGAFTGQATAEPLQTVNANVRYAYQLVPEITVDPVAGPDADGLLNNAGTIRFTVRGFSYNQGRLAGSVRIQEDIEVLPKCCSRSLGATFGNDLRPCNRDLSPGYGLLFGTSAYSDGTIKFTGSKGSIKDDEGNTIDPLVCVVSETSDCPASGSVTVGSGTPDIEETPPSFTLPPPDRFPVTGTVAENTKLANGNTPQAAKSSAGTDLTVIPAPLLNPPGLGASTAGASTNCPTTGSIPFICRDSTSGRTRVNADQVSLSSLPDYCGYTQEPLPSDITQNADVIHCHVDFLDLPTSAGAAIEVRTSELRNLRLYFTQEGDLTSNTGNGEFLHVDTTTGTPIGSGDPTRQLTLFGCREGSSGGCENLDNSLTSLDRDESTNSKCDGAVDQQCITLNGNAVAANDPYFVYAPTGAVRINGGSDLTFNGVLWTNNIRANGGVNIIVPGSGLISVLEFYGIIDPTGSGKDKPIVWDYIARAVRRFTLLPGT